LKPDLFVGECWPRFFRASGLNHQHSLLSVPVCLPFIPRRCYSPP
jgi:hypothetical protein